MLQSSPQDSPVSWHISTRTSPLQKVPPGLIDRAELIQAHVIGPDQ